MARRRDVVRARRPGRPRGLRSTCPFCEEVGHNSTGGTCSAVAIAERLVSDGASISDAARQTGVSHQAVRQRIKANKMATERAELAKIAHESMESW